MFNNRLIRLLVFDIDGVLTRGEGKALDLDLLKDLALLNQAARKDPALPGVTLCTGRPSPYVEVMLQAIDGHLPGIFENGAGLYVPSDYKFLPHPDLQHRTDMRGIRKRLEETLVKDGTANFQPGKEYTLTLLPTEPTEKYKLHDQTLDALGMFDGTFDLASSPSCLNILPHNIHKGRGIEFLCTQTGYNPSELLGVGDSGVDIQFLSLVGFSAAPANADQEIKEIVQYISPYLRGEGVRDILKQFNVWS
jgi:hydroxymethylpyrimidine pyrophosphatase-like HAD family hydrolase